MGNISQDWREQGQEKYLSGLLFQQETYHAYREGWGHDHCEFCNVKFSNDITDCLTEGYSANHGYYWVCKQCMIDFKVKYNLLIEN